MRPDHGRAVVLLIFKYQNILNGVPQQLVKGLYCERRDNGVGCLHLEISSSRSFGECENGFK
jgi:hypothetical protein